LINQINLLQLGKMDYLEALEIQCQLNEKVREGEIKETLILVEHPPVITIGKHGEHDHILLTPNQAENEGVELIQTDRGGDVTYHGPGQLVAYPILNLRNYKKDIHLYVWRLEEVIIRLLNNEYNVQAGRASGKYTGVWIGDEKITAIGVAVKKWVTMHGLAFNVNTNLEHFDWIIPCGLSDKRVTSLEKQIGKQADFNKVSEKVIHYFSEVFEAEVKEV